MWFCWWWMMNNFSFPIKKRESWLIFMLLVWSFCYLSSLIMILCLQGFQYQLGDFQLRVGKVSPAHSETLRGIVMEVIWLWTSKSRLVEFLQDCVFMFFHFDIVLAGFITISFLCCFVLYFSWDFSFDLQDVQFAWLYCVKRFFQ